jgi:hypothetical protein
MNFPLTSMRLTKLLFMGLSASCFFWGCACAQAQRLPAPTRSVSPSEKAPFGVNLEALTDWARISPFVDMMKTSRVWGSADAPWTATTQVDALGWPTGDAGVVVAVRTLDAGDEANPYPYQFLTPGVYRLRFTGKATITHISSPNVSITNYKHDAASNRSTADVVIGKNAPQLMLSFRNTSGGVRDVSLLRPGYDDQQTFTNEFIQAVSPFGVLRFMDYLSTNQTRVESWKDRTTPASATQASEKGGAYEYIVQMANELGKDIWINVPARADDAYVRALAELLKKTLAPGRVVYVEYSNEVWNWMFPQAVDNRDAALKEAVAGDTTLTNGTKCTKAMFNASKGDNCNIYWAAYFRVGKRLVNISRIFSEVFGAEAVNSTIRPVYAAQWGNPSIAELVLKNIATYRGKPSSSIYGLATAPYFNIPPELVTSTSATADQLLRAALSSQEKVYSPYFAAGVQKGNALVRRPYQGEDLGRPTHKALADFYGIKSLAYEGGLDFGQSGVNARAKLQANRDPRMGEIVKAELAQWYGCGNDLFMYFSLSSPWQQHGYWGLTNNGLDLNTPKYVAAREVSESARANFKSCH